MRHQLVTLNVRETPLKNVLRKIEWQTWTRIRAERSLDDTRITLHAANQPLADVLKRLAQQASARSSTLYAVYSSSRGLKALDSALSGDGQIESVGWKRIAPGFAPLDQNGPEAVGPVHRGRVAKELVLENSVSGRLTGDEHPAPTPEAAIAIARTVKGKWTTYFALSKSSMSGGFFGGGGGGGFGPASSGKPPSQADLDRLIRGFNPNDRFAKLTPAQRVDRARRARGFHQP